MKPTNTTHTHGPQSDSAVIAALKAELKKQQNISNEMRAEIEKLKATINQQPCNPNFQKEQEIRKECINVLKEYASCLLEDITDDFCELFESGTLNTSVALTKKCDENLLGLQIDPEMGIATVKATIKFND